MTINKTEAKKIFNRKGGSVSCYVCGHTIYSYDFPHVEHIRTKRKQDIFIHSECVRKGR